MDDKKVKILLGKRIKQLRQSFNFTQFVLGEKIDINQRQVAQIESGHSFPSLSTLVKSFVTLSLPPLKEIQLKSTYHL